MLRGSLIVVVAALVALTGSAQKAAPAKSDTSSDVRFLMSEIRRIHPNPFHTTPEPVFQAAADDLAARAPSLNQDQLLVELMRFVNLLGEREGHSGIFTLDSGNVRTFHVYPLYLYKFSDGLFVVTAPKNKSLVGSRLLAIDGMPVDGLEQKVRPLVPRDNEATRTDRFMSFMLTGEVLHGVGLRPGVGPARFTVQKPGGAAQDVTIAPVTAAAYVNIMQPYFPTFVYALPKRSKPLYLRRRGQDHYVTTLEHGRVVYVGYNRVLGSTGPDARKLLRLVKNKRFRRVIVDLRLNPGGDNHTYVDLLRALRSKRVNKKGRLVVLIGRSTFSAAQEVHHRARAEDPSGVRRRDVGWEPEPVRRRPAGRPPERGPQGRHRGDLLAEELRRRLAGRDRAEGAGRAELEGVLRRQGPGAGGGAPVPRPLAGCDGGRGAGGGATREQDPGQSEPDHGPGRDRHEDEPSDSLEIGADGERVSEEEGERREARVVEQSPAAVPDPPLRTERDREHQGQPSGDHARGRTRSASTARRTGRAPRGGRSGAPGRGGQSAHAARPSRARSRRASGASRRAPSAAWGRVAGCSIREPEPDGESQEAERHEPGGPREEPDGGVRRRRSRRR